MFMLRKSLLVGLTLSLGFVTGCPTMPPADPCAGVSCNTGESCVDGNCVADAPTADVVSGEAYFMARGCANCHAADAAGVEGSGPSITGTNATTIFDKLSGAVFHVGGTRPGVTEQDSLDVEAWIASLSP